MSWQEDHDRARPPAQPKEIPLNSARVLPVAVHRRTNGLRAARHARAMAAPIVGRQEKTILFDVSKRELFTPNQGLKGLRRKLGSQFTIAVNKDAITLAVLREASVFAIVGPREKFSAAEFEAMNEYMKEGGSIFITLGEEGESKFATNVNYFCEEYGIAFNQDAVVRTVYYKYLHPKEVHIANGVLNREINVASGRRPRAGAVSGALGGGRLCVLGSSYVLQDDWVDKEENGKLVNVLLRWLTHDGGVTMDSIDADDPDVAEYHQLPDSEALAERVRCFLEETEEVEFTACNCSPRRSPPPHRCAAVSRRQRRSRRTSRRSSTTRCSNSTPLSSRRL